MKFANDPLWQKIDTFPLDDPAFTQKLAKENNWTAHFTARTIREYKRFIYLCCILPKGASPPPVVDEVWHLHILYTVNYWEEFCDKTLGRKLHHHPSKGGSEEKERHVNWLQDTIEYYGFIFGEEPPKDIWGTALPRDINLLTPSEKENFPLLWRILILVLVATVLFLIGWKMYIFPLVVAGIAGYFLYTSPGSDLETDRRNNRNGSSCGGNGSSCGGSDSSCGSSDSGGGCGGCGGGGGD